MKTDIKKVLLIVFTLLSCCNLLVQAQQQSGDVVSAQDVQNQDTSNTAQQAAATATIPAQQAATTTAAQVQQPTTTAAQVAVTTQDQSNNNPTTTNAVVADTTTAAGAVAPTNSSTDYAATQNNNGRTKNNNNNTGVSANTDNTANPTDGSNTTNDPSSPTQSNNQNQQQNQNQDNNSGENKTPVIAGAVVGGIVGLAVIAGIFTWLNRRGGCTSRTHRRNLPRDYDAQDFDLKMAENNNNTTTTDAPSSPFQHARRFVPPTSGYMNLADEEYNTTGYHHSQSEPLYNDPYTQQPYDQVYLNTNDNAQPYGTQDYLADNSTTAASYYSPHSASPTLIASPAPLIATDNNGGMVPVNYHIPMKPDQIDQKPNAA